MTSNVAAQPIADRAGVPAFVHVRGIGKSFSGTTVLRDVDIDFRTGEVHALIGENGAGKSTVGKIVGGYYAADSGSVEVEGRPVGRFSPRNALAHGIAMIHQELQLVPQLTVAQNVFLGIERNILGATLGDEAKRFRELDKRCSFGLDPDALVADLNIADRQKVEIMRALARDARLIIMDEPASSLTVDQVDRLHDIIMRLRQDNRGVVYITHQLDHVLAICDRVTIMRDGRRVRTAPVVEETRSSLIEGMVGDSEDIVLPDRPPRPARDVAPVLEVCGVSSANGLQNVSITVRPGEIVGLIGLVGSGRSELARAIFGADPLLSGQISLSGERYRKPSARESVRRRIAFVPEDRRKQGLDLTQPMRSNISLVHLHLVSSRGVLGLRSEYALAHRFAGRLGIVPSDPDSMVVTYSGGNQQKVLLARWTCERPVLAILDEPSRGVDIAARRRIHEFVVELARQGTGVLLISSELDEVLGLAHRGYLMRNGRVLGEMECDGVSEAEALRRLFSPDEHDRPPVAPAASAEQASCL